MNHPRDLPNIHGYQFIGILSDGGERVPCIVVRDGNTGTCYVEGAKYCELAGWEPIEGARTEEGK